MNKNFTHYFLYTVDESGNEIVNLNNLFDNIDNQLSELLPKKITFSPSDKTVNRILDFAAKL